MDEDFYEMIFGRKEITREERSWLKHSVVGATLWMPGGMYGSEWKGEGPSPAQRYIESFRGKGDEKFAEFKRQQSPTGRNPRSDPEFHSFPNKE